MDLAAEPSSNKNKFRIGNVFIVYIGYRIGSVIRDRMISGFATARTTGTVLRANYGLTSPRTTTRSGVVIDFPSENYINYINYINRLGRSRRRRRLTVSSDD